MSKKFNFALVGWALLLLGSPTLNAMTVNTPLALYHQLSKCHSSTDPTVLIQNNTRVTLKSNPQGYCMLTIKKAKLATSFNCYFSQDDVNCRQCFKPA